MNTHAPRNIPYVGGLQVADHGFATLSAEADAKAAIFPRGLGTFIKEIQIPVVRLRCTCWSIFNTIQEKDQRMHIDIPNRFTQGGLYEVVISGNVYANCLLQSFNINAEDKLYCRYSFEFTLGEQNDGVLNADLKDGAGSEAVLTVPQVKILDRVIKSNGTFHFWSHAAVNTQTQWTGSIEMSSERTLKPLGGGLRSLSLDCWLIASDTQSRKQIENFAKSVCVNAVGRFGSLWAGGNTYNPVFCQSYSMSEEDSHTITYNVNFLMSTQQYS